MRHLLTFILIFIATGLLTVSCAETCNDNKNALPRAGFYIIDSLGAVQSVQIDSIEVIGVGKAGDSILSSVSQRISELYMPFRIDNDRTQYVFVNKAGGANIADTVTFDYTRVARFASAECGVSYVFHIHDISWQGKLIDSVTCPSGFIDNSAIENLHIYLRY